MKLKIHILFFSMLLLCACTETGILEQRKGYVRFAPTVDETVELMPVTRAAAGQADLTRIIVSKASGQQVLTLEGDALNEEISIYTGMYKARATVGSDAGEAAFDTPFYAGECDFSVRANVVSQVNIPCSLSGVMVTVSVSPELALNFTYEVEVGNGNATLLYDPQTGTIDKTGYFANTGKLTWSLNLENAHGEKFTVVETITDVAQGQHYDLVFSLEQTDSAPAGESDFKIIVSDSLNEAKVHDVTLVIDKSAPLFAGSDKVSKYAGEDVAETKFNINSSLPYSSFVISHTDELLQQYGLSAQTQLYGVSDLTALSAAGIALDIYDADKTKLTAIDDTATDVNLDFSALYNRLPVGSYKIVLSAANASGKSLEKEIELVVESAFKTLDLNPWSRFIYLKGVWSTTQKPQAMTVQYRLGASGNWESLSDSDIRIDGNIFRAFVLGLSPGEQYQIRIVTAHETTEVRTVDTEQDLQLYNNDFEIWSGSGDFYYPYPSNATDAQRVWDCANKGMEDYQSFNIKGNTSRVSGENESVSGYGVKMESIYAQVKFAAGNLYTGRFNSLVGTKGADLDWGVPFTVRPLGIKVNYRYLSKLIDNVTSAYSHLKGKEYDMCQIQIVLQDVGRPYKILPTTFNGASINGPTLDEAGTYIDLSVHESVIARGIRNYGDTDGKLIEEILPFEYRSITRIPTHAIVTFSSSYLGDYFTGGQGSTMWIDDLQYIYDPMELSVEDREAFFSKFD